MKAFEFRLKFVALRDTAGKKIKDADYSSRGFRLVFADHTYPRYSLDFGYDGEELREDRYWKPEDIGEQRGVDLGFFTAKQFRAWTSEKKAEREKMLEHEEREVYNRLRRKFEGKKK